MFTDFTLRGTWMAAMDSSLPRLHHTQGSNNSLCRDQRSTAVSSRDSMAVPEAEHCGWCVDRQGRLRQVVPPTTLPNSWPTPPPARSSAHGKITWPACRPPSHHVVEATTWWLRPEALTILERAWQVWDIATLLNEHSTDSWPATRRSRIESDGLPSRCPSGKRSRARHRQPYSSLAP